MFTCARNARPPFARDVLMQLDDGDDDRQYPAAFLASNWRRLLLLLLLLLLQRTSSSMFDDVDARGHEMKALRRGPLPARCEGGAATRAHHRFHPLAGGVNQKCQHEPARRKSIRANAVNALFTFFIIDRASSPDLLLLLLLLSGIARAECSACRSRSIRLNL